MKAVNLAGGPGTRTSEETTLPPEPMIGICIAAACRQTIKPYSSSL